MRILKRALLAVLLLGVVLFLASAFVAWWFIYRPMPRTTGTVRVPGLSREVVVRRDSLGVPHISAQSLPDLYFAQGYVTAQDRLWQMDTLRRLSGGTLAAVMGEAGYRSDVDRRMLSMTRIAARAARSLPADQRRLFEAYAGGVNAYIEAHRGNLPIEFRLLKYEPRPWTVDDSALVALQMFHILTTSWRDELFKLLVLSKFGAQRAAELLLTRSDRDHLPGEVQGPKSKVQSRAAREVQGPASEIRGAMRAREVQDSFTPVLETSHSATESQGEEHPDSPLCVSVPLWQIPPVFGSIDGEAAPGSNNWVVSGAHTASGRAMLANDPHLPYSVPSVWHAVQLQAPGMDAAGVTMPGLPAVLLGHNQRIAWGATNLGADVEDLYIEKFDPQNPELYEVDGEWERAETLTEKIAVRGGAAREVTFTLTRHGPIVLTERGARYVLRWAGADPIPWSFPFFRVNSSRNWEEFRAAFADYFGPAQNLVYADVDGNIGYQAAGKLPIRPRGDGSVPLDGASRANDWKGYIPYDALPSVYNPPSGMIATANGRVFPASYPYSVGTKWASPDRTERIYELLKAGGKFRPGDFIRMQMDVFSRHYKTLAGAFARALERRRSGDASARRLAAQLRQWNGEITAGSSEAAVTQFARYQLIKAVLAPRIGAAHLFYRWPMNSIFFERLVTEQPRAWLPASQDPSAAAGPAGRAGPLPGRPDFDELLAGCVDAAVENLRTHFRTDDSTRWPWGQLMFTVFQHPLASQLPAFLQPGFGVPAFRQDGNGYTVKQVTGDLGPSMRMVVDFGDLDGTLLTLSMGESGLPFSPHFKDQFAAWHAGRGLKFLFSNTAVERESREVLRLRP